MPKRFDLSDETSRIIAYLQSLDKGTIAAYDEISRIVGFHVTSNTGYLTSARRILQQRHNAVWVCVRPFVGVRRLTDSEIVERAQPYWMRSAGRKLKRGNSEAEVVDLTLLDLNQQARYGVDGVQRHLALEALSRSTRKRLEKVARGNSNDLPAFNIVEWAINLTPRKG